MRPVGPVQASLTVAVVSCTTACAICPAAPDQAFTSQVLVSGRNAAEVVGSGG